MRKTIWYVVLVIGGIAVAATSLYQARVERTMEMFGFVGQEGSEMFDIDKLKELSRGDSWWQCEDKWEALWSAKYYLSTGRQQIDLGWRLGEDRIKCGVSEIVQGDFEAGVFKVMRGAKYWEGSLLLKEKLGVGCESLARVDYVEKLDQLQCLANGSVKVELSRVAERISERIRYEAERCIDQ